MGNMNRIANSSNRFQGAYKKVLCVCSAGLLRSPTAALVISQEFGHNTRAAGISTEYALIPVDEVLLLWADEVVCMEAWQCTEVYTMMHDANITDTPVINLNVDDRYKYRDPILMSIIKEQYAKHEAISRTDERGHAEETSEPSPESTGTL